MLTLNMPFDQPCGAVLAGKVCIFEPLKKLIDISKNKMKRGRNASQTGQGACRMVPQADRTDIWA